MKTVEEYLDSVESEHKKVLEHIRSLVKSVVPEAEESISYGLPTFKYNNKPLIYYASFKEHMSLFPTPGAIAQLEEDLADFKTSKGTIQFTLKKPLSDKLLKRIVLARLAAIS